MTALVLQADAAHLPLPDSSVDLIVTSPPYFALRSYQDGGEHYAGQIGSEATPAEFLEALWTCTREWMRVLKPAGSLFVNLGDKYAGGGGQWDKDERPDPGRRRAVSGKVGTGGNTYGLKPKSLIGIPWRYAIGCIDTLGLILRAEIVWAKPNCLSGGTMLYAKVKGRPTTIKVHDLCRTYAPEDVQLWNGQQWTQVLWWQPTGRHEDAAESYKAIRAARRRGDEPIVGGDIEIELRSGERIGCTREHRWPTSRGLIHAADLQVGDVLETCPMPEGEITPAGLDDETVGWFVGLYIAEGSRSEGTIQLAGHVKELERYKRLRDLSDAYHGTCKVHATGGNTATINLTGRFLDAMLDSYVGGKTSKDKHLRPACWQRSNRFLRAVLDGYLSGDGHWREDARKWILRFTDNDYLAADLRSLGARLGLSVRLSRCTHTGFGREWPGWRGDILEPDRRRKPDSEIVAIRQSRARQFWDIGVADDPHLFALASGVLTHNSLPESVTDRVRRSHEQWFMFQQSGGVESVTEDLPFCPLCGRPVDARTTLVQRLKEANGGVIPSDLSHHVGADERVKSDRASGSNLDHGRVSRSAGVPPLVERDSATRQDSSQLFENGVVAVVNHDPEVRVPAGCAGEGDSPLTVDDSGKPPEVCDCVRHPFILDDEPWIPQSVAADIMQGVADGEIDPRTAADFLSGDYARTHSTWFHFTQQPRYFSAGDEIREPQDTADRKGPRRSYPAGSASSMKDGEHQAMTGAFAGLPLNPLGKLPGSVWNIPSEPLTVPAHLGVDHFAAFPTAWPRQLILGWSPSGICTACGEGRRPVTTAAEFAAKPFAAAQQVNGRSWHGGDPATRSLGIPAADRERAVTGYACACPDTSAPTQPSLILDPFGGTGTTAAVASALGRIGISVDLSHDYARIAAWRTVDPDLRAKVRRERRPVPQVAGQLGMFDDELGDPLARLRGNILGS